MTKQKRIVCNQNLKEFAQGVIAHAKNGPRAVFRQTNDNGAYIEVTYSDIPADGQNYAKIMKHQPECLWGTYTSQAKLERIIADLSEKD